jgi:ring-1,2-phenylacetyl-CoA epoxidase subunit PaaD
VVTSTALDPTGLVEQVADPELAFLSIGDLGIVREVTVIGNLVDVRITPTYSGCPAMDAIKTDIETVLAQNGFEARIHTVLSPAWTTDDLSERGRALLAQHGFAPPQPDDAVQCPRCASGPAKLVSRFGSTACKALMVCRSCHEPFDLFKELR